MIGSPGRKFWRLNPQTLTQEASQIDWALSSKTDLDCCWHTFLAKIRQLESLAPLMRDRPVTQCPPWFDKDLRSCIRKRKRLWDKFMSTRCDADYVEYRTVRNQCTSMKRRKRELFERQLANTSQGTPKRLYAYIRRRVKSSSPVPTLKNSVGENIESDSCKAAVLAGQYNSVYKVESSDPPTLQQSDMILPEISVNPEAVRLLLEGLDVQSSPGPDNIHPLMLKTLSKIINIPLAEIFQLSLNLGKLPEEWKHGVVKPMYKGGDSSIPANYRPVTLTSVVGKVLERIVKDHLERFLRDTNQVSESQHGFTKHRSCVSNLLTAREQWCQHLDLGKPVDAFFIDFSKAFDRVPHKRLLAKLKASGVGGRVLEWIQDFLVARKSQVEVNGARSDPSFPTSGVPQGSVLGPLLFKHYVSDLPGELSSGCLLFADDLKVWATVSTAAEGPYLQSELNRVVEWTDRWMLPINEEKCAVMHFGPGNPQNQYYLGTHPIRVVDVERDLGVMSSSSLKTKEDTAKKVGSASRMWWAIRRSFSVMTPEIFKVLFASHVRPILEYGLRATYPLAKGERDKLEKVQRRATKCVQGLHHRSYEDRLGTLNLFPLEYRRKRYDLLVTRRILLGQYGTDLQKFFPLSTDSRTRGHARKLQKRRTVRLKTPFTLSTRVVNLWNALPSEAVEVDSEDKFKRILDGELPAILSRWSTLI